MAYSVNAFKSGLDDFLDRHNIKGYCDTRPGLAICHFVQMPKGLLNILFNSSRINRASSMGSHADHIFCADCWLACAEPELIAPCHIDSETPVSCCVVQRLPGLNGRDGPQGIPGPKGEKSYTYTAPLNHSIIETLLAKVINMEAELRNLKLNVAVQKKALVFSKGTSAAEKLYATRGEDATYVDDKSICSKAGGQLAPPRNDTQKPRAYFPYIIPPRNDAENNAVLSLSLQYNKALVLGIDDKQNESTFRYSNNDKIVYSKWKPGEPNDDNGVEDCVELHIEGIWNDMKCDLKRPTVCEFA
ncbi:hypothetical protein XELAEV_18034974mg [Xenopus laevis]|uniref:C-type lectin domain-containing protein n=1 Tax=Xenopus laevis TaxID=8355 RepID=A0A974CF18_XENLA|nr:hypothetical protein XELAEV_18034974mg [Xenopus laevis]